MEDLQQWETSPLCFRKAVANGKNAEAGTPVQAAAYYKELKFSKCKAQLGAGTQLTGKGACCRVWFLERTDSPDCLSSGFACAPWHGQAQHAAKRLF